MTTMSLDEHLQDSIRFLRNSSEAFDKGFDGDAKRLAVTARVLVHDTTKSHSLLGQMGLLTIPFYSTGPRWDPRNLLPHHGLIQIGVRVGGASYRAPLDDRPPHVLRWTPFAEWWSELVFDDRKGNTLTRRDLVLALANKEGGAHVDPKLTPSYETLTKHSTFWVLDTAQGTQALEGRMERLAMRQIAHELLRTLERAGYGSVVKDGA